jgi:RNA polymerase sigma-70 factor (ECF subfamily)
VTCAITELLIIGADDRAQPTCRGDEPRVRALVTAAQNGHREAFGELVSLHERVVFRTALAAVRTREDAEDVTQEAFVAAWRKLHRFRGESTFRTWILRIVWRKAIDRRRLRRLWWQRTQAHAEHDGAGTEQLGAPDASPEQRAIARDLERRTRKAIDGLSPKLRDALLLAASGEYTYEEIGATLDAPVGTIKWRVAEARKRLREKLEV